MWRSRCNDLQSWAGPAFGAILCTLMTQGLSSRQSELYSEVLNWLLLPSLFAAVNPLAEKVLPRHGAARTSPKPPSTWLLWIVAFCISVSSVYKAEIGVISFFPALTPLLLFAQRSIHFDGDITSQPLPPKPSVQGPALVALISIFSLSCLDLSTSALSSIPVTALYVVYSSFLNYSPLRHRPLPTIRFEENVRSLSWRVAIILAIALGVRIAKSGLDTTETIVLSLGVGLIKTLSWYFTAKTAQPSSWLIAPAIGTFSILATQNPFLQTSELQALSLVTSSLLGLVQIVRNLPQQIKSRNSVWIFALVPLVPYLLNSYEIRNADSSDHLGSRGSQPHPVEILADQAKSEFQGLLARQSRNYADAESKYKDRSGIEPPPGFEDWFRYATLHESPVIDDFADIQTAISPFLQMSGSKIQQMISKIDAAPDTELWHCKVTTKPNKIDCTHPWRTNDRHFGLLFNTLLANIDATLPEFTFFVNHLDEPRVLIPPARTKNNTSPYDLTFTQTDLSQKPTWEALTQFCGASTPNPFTSTNDTNTLPFVTNRTSALNLCYHPEYHNMHGLLFSPTSFQLLSGPIPILSTGAPSTMSDILIPSPAYIESAFRYNPSSDIPWSKKYNNLYWAGSTSGGLVSDSTPWQNMHRQRFVALAQFILPKKRFSYLYNNAGMITRIKSSFLNSRLYNVFFTKIYQCTSLSCRAQSLYFRIRSWAPKDAALHSRLVFDLDGNGISGRFYKLLASNSCVLKQTILREWHDGRLIPWYHYVPVSLGMEELPELVFFLTSTERGREVAERIARQGQEGYRTGLREVDFRVYVWRLFLELGRVMEGGRAAGSE